MAPCSLITPQGVVQNKSFLSPNSANQQFIMSGNGQISPIGQMYSTLVVPQSLHTSQSNGPTFVQQSTTIVQQQTTMMNNNNNNSSSGSGSGGGGNAVNETDISINVPQSVSTQTSSHTVHTVTSSPPDTTTHSPRSPERPDSQRSIASDINMVGVTVKIKQICQMHGSMCYSSQSGSICIELGARFGSITSH